MLDEDVIVLCKRFLELVEATQNIRRVDWDYLMIVIHTEDDETLRKMRTEVLRSRDHWVRRYDEIKKSIEEKLISIDLELRERKPRG